MEIGKRIAALRETKGWTTNRLANQCGLSQSFLRSVELGEKGISVESLSLLCDALGVSLKQFFDQPSGQDTEREALLRQVDRLTPIQRQALSVFGDPAGRAMTRPRPRRRLAARPGPWFGARARLPVFPGGDLDVQLV